MRPNTLITVSGISFLLTACGGSSGGGGNVAPLPPPPATSPPTFDDLKSTTFNVVGATSQLLVEDIEGTTTSARSVRSDIRITYDAASTSYTLSDGSRERRFGPQNKTEDGSWETIVGDHAEVLTLTLAQQMLGLKYVSVGQWHSGRDQDGALDYSLALFTYGFPTAGQAIPRTGAANYEVMMLGIVTENGEVPLVVAGTGNFETDFVSGSFRASGDGLKSPLFSEAPSGTSWRAGGRMTSGNGFAGSLTISGTYKTVSAELQGMFYGPHAGELGGTFRGDDGNGTSLAGTLAGRKITVLSQNPFTVLPNGRDRSYFSLQQGMALAHHKASNTYSGGVLVWPSSFSSIEFTADNAVELTFDRSSGSAPIPTYLATDRIAAESNDRFTTYAKTATPNERLVLSNPGPSNTQIALTYSSFGYWESTTDRTDGTYLVQDWFVYGIRPNVSVLARTGTGNYSGLIAGQGANYKDGARYTVAGTIDVALNFSSRDINGTLRPVASPIGSAPAYELANTSFTARADNNWGFRWHAPTPGLAQGQGALFGPTGEEMAGTFEQLIFGPHGATGMFSGVFVSKLQE